jgi:hypothetical protein
MGLMNDMNTAIYDLTHECKQMPDLSKAIAALRGLSDELAVHQRGVAREIGRIERAQRTPAQDAEHLATMRTWRPFKERNA